MALLFLRSAFKVIAEAVPQLRASPAELADGTRVDTGIDSRWRLVERGGMRRWLSLLLLMGALFGLMGQETALAQTAPAIQVEHAMTTSRMDPDCAEMMELAKQSEPEKPCQGMTFDCIAKMGCAVPFALLPDRTLDAPLPFRAAAPPQQPAAPLIGRDIGPEPQPPTLFG